MRPAQALELVRQSVASTALTLSPTTVSAVHTVRLPIARQPSNLIVYGFAIFDAWLSAFKIDKTYIMVRQQLYNLMAHGCSLSIGIR